MLTINWREPDIPNGVFSHYTVFYLPVSGPYGQRKLAQDGEFAMDFTGTSATLTNLNGSVTYRIEVSAIALYNGIELVGDWSNAVMITTLEGGTTIVGSLMNPCINLFTVPSAPQSLAGECMTNSSIFLSWRRPDPPNGLIINYTVSIMLSEIYF